MSTFTTNLLRRTALAFAAVAGLAITSFSQQAAAAVITLTNASGNSCSYSSMSVAPDGSFNVQCSGGPPTNPPPSTTGVAGTFSFVSATGTTGGVIGSNYQFPVSRTGGTTGQVDMYYTVGGAGCVNGVGSLSFPDGSSASQSAQVMVIANSAQCTITLGTPTTSSSNVTSAPTLGGASVMTLTVPAANTPPPTGNTPTPPPGCPAVPTDLVTLNLGGIGNPLFAMTHSGQTVSLSLPAVQSGYSSGSIVFSESAGGAYTPNPVTLDISINKCPGVIDTDQTNSCNYHSTNGNYNAITWFGKAYQSIVSAAQANPRGLCWAGDAGTQYYVNARWTYQSCAFGAQVCGFAVQQNIGPY